jgi:hypothetical protein
MIVVSWRASCRAAAEGVKLGLRAKRFVAKDLIFDVERAAWNRSRRQFLERQDLTGGSEIGNGSCPLAVSA